MTGASACFNKNDDGRDNYDEFGENFDEMSLLTRLEPFYEVRASLYDDYDEGKKERTYSF